MTPQEQLREACAKVCEVKAEYEFKQGRLQAARALYRAAAAIRAIDLTQFERGDR